MRLETLYHSNLTHKHCARYDRLHDRIHITFNQWKEMEKKMKKVEKAEKLMGKDSKKHEKAEMSCKMGKKAPMKKKK